MTGTVLPAPLWRRFGAAVYDLLLLVGLWMATLLLSLPLRSALALPPGHPALRLLLFVVGYGFFAWFWVRGGQTLGMRAWRLQLRRDDGAALRLPVASVRYAAMLAFWTLVLTPVAVALMQRLPSLAGRFPHAGEVAAAASLAVVLTLALRALDARGRLPQDWLSGCEVVLLPPV